jgi:hypothetical protein
MTATWYEIVRGIAVVLLWVAMWGIIEMIIDAIVKDNKLYRFIAYIVTLLLGILIVWILEITI